MSDDTQNLTSIATNETEPTADRTPVPILLIGLFALIAFWGMTYLDRHGGGFDATVYAPYQSAEAEEVERPFVAMDMKKVGGRIFQQNCVACHQASGLGLPGQFPPLGRFRMGERQIAEPHYSRGIEWVGWPDHGQRSVIR